MSGAAEPDRIRRAQQVREMPDQTLAQAMAKLHHAAQDQSPVMLSLACDNHKLIVERNGNIDIPTNPTKPDDVALDPPKGIDRIAVKFGDGNITKLTRYLDGGWLPAPVIEAEDKNGKYNERSMVIPARNGSPVGVVEFRLHSATAAPVKTFLACIRDTPLQGRCY